MYDFHDRQGRSCFAVPGQVAIEAVSKLFMQFLEAALSFQAAIVQFPGVVVWFSTVPRRFSVVPRRCRAVPCGSPWRFCGSRRVIVWFPRRRFAVPGAAKVQIQSATLSLWEANDDIEK